MAADMDPTDFEFLTMMSRLLADGAQMARAYLANSNPETRRANVADLARETVSEHDRIMKQVQGWLDETTPPGSSHDGERPIGMMY